MKSTNRTAPIKILLADDDSDDRYFFDLIVKKLDVPVDFATVEDGVELMDYLGRNVDKLPDVLFLDLNMPRKNGSECLTEIKADPKLKGLPVIIYSTSLHEDNADLLYAAGAHYYIKKTDMLDLKKILNYTLGLMKKNNFSRPGRERFVLSASETAEK